MIKPNELRLNNVIQFDDSSNDIVVVDWLFRSSDMWFVQWTKLQGKGTFEKGNSILDDFNPIQLTPKILEGAGFEYDRITYTKGQIMLSEGDKGYNIWYNSLTHGRINNISLEYIHQLQNLYFALTGNELGITL